METIVSLGPIIPDADTRRRLVENLRRARVGMVLSERTIELIEFESERDWTESPAGHFDARREARRRGESSLESQRENNWHALRIGRKKIEEWWSLQEQEWKRRQDELSELLQRRTCLEEWQCQKQQSEHWWQQKQQERDFHQQRLQEWLERQDGEYRDLEAPGPDRESELDL